MGTHLLRRRYSSRGPGAIRGQNSPAQMSNPALARLLPYRKHPQKPAARIREIAYSTPGWSSSPSAPRSGSPGIPGPPRQRYALRHRLGVASRYEASPHSKCAQEESMKSVSMKIVSSFLLAAALACTTALPSYAEPRQVLQGTQVHLTLLSGITSAVARDGDPFVAVVAEPVYLGTQLLLPAGTRVNGIIGTVEKARLFSTLRGQAYMNLSFRSIEVDSRLIPVQMSIIAIEQPHGQADGKRRKDVKIEEGQVVEQKHDIKGDIVGGAIGAGGGTLIGAVFSHAIGGLGIGLAGSAAYIVERKGKEVELPAQTGMVVRMDNTINVPSTNSSNSGYTTTR